jgi:monoamine oxidase
MFDVIIIGAGLAGLTCAMTLKKESPSLRVLIVEASSRIGGRVYPTIYNGQHIELGAELVHGENTILASLLHDLSLDTKPVYTWAQGDGGPHPNHHVSNGCGYYYLGKEHILLRYDSIDPDFIHLHDVVKEMDQSKSTDHQTLWEYLLSQGVSPRMKGLVEAGYANTLCANLSWLPIKQTSIVMNGFKDDGDKELRCVPGYKSLLDFLSKDITIWTNWPVSYISWEKNKVKIYSVYSYKYVTASSVVVTPSIAVMKTNDIIFHPPLSITRSKIYHKIKMEPCIKIIVQFTKPFWPDDLHGMICADCTIPEFWTITTNNRYSVICFATSTFAVQLQYLTKEEIIKVILHQFDIIFNKKASPLFMDIKIQDWTKDQYIKGGYSAPSPGITTEDRKIIATPISNTLFFAGEATCPIRYMVMHAAIESGIRVAKEIQEKYRISKL